MKKVLLTVAVLGTIFLSACEKDDALVPEEKSLLKADKGILCRGCADWDFTGPGSGDSTTLRTASNDGQTELVAVPSNDSKTKKRK